ncbi:hypothetical protein BOTBODRAFT_145345 [Botryobasidium botryosum FD-172 SS1]|uniref:Prenylcysteine lyase domain-containing protein n=1 Tax=Botryobasidium botryosum (strain FD-172 SS1) TaxID=930990 RepID=A0A067MU23_BOTB1|nr:hypothetical protein BOTBODRAFT_145345 [Botryobasidium botryosum FD-172 SS1]
MLLLRTLPLILPLTSTALALQLPFNIPFLSTKPSPPPPDLQKPRVAIIGAGAAGSSAAFWIAQAKKRLGVDVEVEVYERESYIGGRSTVVYPHNDENNLPVTELGASIFVKANRNLMRAAKEFNLTLMDFQDEGDSLGIWDGENFLLQTSGGSGISGWWETLKMLWRYGYSAPTQTRALVNDFIETYLDLYQPTRPVWEEIVDLSIALNSSYLLGVTAAEYFDLSGVGRKFSREVIESATRVNYLQNLDHIHALGGLCSMAASGASGVVGGNYQLFEQFLARSNASVHLSTEVTGIQKSTSPSGKTLWILRTAESKSLRPASENPGPAPNTYLPYSHVILAAPHHSSSLELSTYNLPHVEYVHIHVTLLTTTAASPNPAYFALSDNARVPNAVLTTYEGVRSGKKEPEFNSISYHNEVTRKDGAEGGEKEWVVKIFSTERKDDEWLESVFGAGKVGWVQRKEWDSYPQLPPRIEFPPVQIDQGLWYVNSLEPWVSTMETQTISSRNVVELLFQEEFGKDLCGKKVGKTGSKKHVQIAGKRKKEWAGEGADGKIWGWDC